MQFVGPYLGFGDLKNQIGVFDEDGLGSRGPPNPSAAHSPSGKLKPTFSGRGIPQPGEVLQGAAPELDFGSHGVSSLRGWRLRRVFCPLVQQQVRHRGAAGPGPCMRPPPPPAPRVLKDSGAGAMAPTAPKFLSHAWLKGGTMPLVLRTPKTFLLAKPEIAINAYIPLYPHGPRHTHTLEVCMW